MGRGTYTIDCLDAGEADCVVLFLVTDAILAVVFSGVHFDRKVQVVD